MDNFQPEYIEADEVIQVDGNYYGIFNVSGPDYNLPLIVFVDSLNYFNNGQPPANVPSFTQEQWEQDNQRLFVPVLDYAQLQDPDDGSWAEIETSLDRALERQAATVGNWIFEDDIVQLYAASALTGIPVTATDLENTPYFLNSTVAEREWMQLKLLAPDRAAAQLSQNKENFNLDMTSLGLTGSGFNSLSSQLALDVSSGVMIEGDGMDGDKAFEILRLLSDPYYRTVSGGDEAIPESYRKYIDTINPTKVGELAAENLIVDYVGDDALAGYIESGVFAKYAGMLRLDAEQETNTGEEQIKQELQIAHDKLNPHFAGAKHSTWSGPLYNYGFQITKIAPNKEFKAYMDRLAKDFKGDYTVIGQQIRNDYQDSPGVKNDILGGMAGQFKQDLSAAFT
tara:strand:- start:1674 stop:2864 length:1191 start_codon:yes stop_codon:yes gene_type:complete